MVESRIMRIFALALCLAGFGAAAPFAQSLSVPVVYKKLPNGLRAWISENHAAPVVVTEEVRVSVLSRRYGALEWLGLPQKANTNWYNAHNFYGALAELEAANLDDVRKFFDTYYAPNNAVLVVSGDTTTDEVMKLAEKQFGGIPQRPLRAR